MKKLSTQNKLVDNYIITILIVIITFIESIKNLFEIFEYGILKQEIITKKSKAGFDIKIIVK
tara:strand:- start:1971 stop:2156 length:186 start_codon:yes stop_codon:yes gene_type:complete